MENAPRPPLVYLSPLPDMRNGIADYAAAVLLRLSEHYECICVVEDPAAISPELTARVTLLSYEYYGKVADRLQDVRHLAHIGNNPDHIPILDVLSQTPGVVVLHDLTMLYLMECWAVQTAGTARSLTELALLLQGDLAARQVRFKFSGAGPLVSMYSEVNCLELLNDLATGVITHSHYGEVLVRSAGFERQISVIPHFATCPSEADKRAARIRWRSQLHIPADATVFASLGFVSPNKTIDVALEALARLPRGLGSWRYIIAGENRDPNVLDTCRRLGLEDRVIFLDYLANEDFDAVLAASDVLINLRYPTSGETSGTVCRALAVGLPCLLSDHGWYAELPDAVSYKVTPGRTAVLDELSHMLLRILLDTETRQAKSAAAQEYARTALTLDQVIDHYRDAIEQAWETQGSSLINGDEGDLPRVLSQALPLQQETLPAMPMLDTLQQALLREQVHVDGRACRLDMLPADLDLPALPEAAHPSEGPLQLCVVQRYHGVAGALLNTIQDSWDRLDLGEFLTVALLQDAPLPVPASAAPLPLRPEFPAGLQAREFLARVLGEAGFELLRDHDMTITPDTAEAAATRISIATARKASFKRPGLSFFRALA